MFSHVYVYLQELLVSLYHPLVQPHQLDPINTHLSMVTFREEWALIHIYLFCRFFFLTYHRAWRSGQSLMSRRSSISFLSWLSWFSFHSRLTIRTLKIDKKRINVLIYCLVCLFYWLVNYSFMCCVESILAVLQSMILALKDEFF